MIAALAAAVRSHRPPTVARLATGPAFLRTKPHGRDWSKAIDRPEARAATHPAQKALFLEHLVHKELFSHPAVETDSLDPGPLAEKSRKVIGHHIPGGKACKTG